MIARPLAPWLVAAALAALPGSRAGAAPPAGAPGPGGLAPSPELMRAVNAAWETLDAARAAPFYAREPGRVFFDLAPLQYLGWEAYASGAAEFLKPVRSMRIALLPGAIVRTAGRTAWGAATMRYDIELRDGNRVSREARWTVVWERKGGAWLIVHEHVSFPDASS